MAKKKWYKGRLTVSDIYKPYSDSFTEKLARYGRKVKNKSKKKDEDYYI